MYPVCLAFESWFSFFDNRVPRVLSINMITLDVHMKQSSETCFTMPCRFFKEIFPPVSHLFFFAETFRSFLLRHFGH